MPKKMETASAMAVFLCILFTILNHYQPIDIYLTLAITFGTISYHLLIRLLVGTVYDLTMNNHVDYHAKWFQSKKWEMPLFKRGKT